MSDTTTIKQVAEKIATLVEKAPAGGIFHDATLGPIRTLSEDGTQLSSTFPLFIVDGIVFDVTVTAHRA